MSSTAHFAAGTLYLLCAVLFVTPLADSRSFFLLDVADMGEFVSNYTDAVLVLGPRYAFGIFEDSNGWRWTDDDSFVGYFGCDDHKHRFQTLKAFTFLSVGFSGFGVIVSLLGSSSKTSGLGFASLAIGILTIIMSVIAMALGWDLWTMKHSCDGFSIKLGNHTKINYGPIFLTIGFFLSLLIPILLAVLGGLAGGAKAETEPVAEKEEPAAEEEKPAESA